MYIWMWIGVLGGGGGDGIDHLMNGDVSSAKIFFFLFLCQECLK